MVEVLIKHHHNLQILKIIYNLHFQAVPPPPPPLLFYNLESYILFIQLTD